MSDYFSRVARDLRGPMMRFAQLHLQHREDAEDAVQEVLLALLQLEMVAVEQVGIKRYLFGILKNKITDRIRRKYRSEVSYDEGLPDDLDNLLFVESGHWADGAAPGLWSAPDAQLQTEQFFRVVDICVNKLPSKPARVFSMKEFLECDPAEICSTLGLTQTDYWQCMSRARKQIQLCLHQNWFTEEVKNEM